MTAAQIDSETVLLNHNKITKNVQYLCQFNNTRSLGIKPWHQLPDWGVSYFSLGYPHKFTVPQSRLRPLRFGILSN